MNTKNIIQTSANVVRIVNLKVGDMYKRYNDSSYDNANYYGIVRAINNDGENTFIEAIEYKKSYSTIEANFTVWRGDKDISIFPATIEEIKDEFEGVSKKIEKEISELEGKIEEKRKCLAETSMLLSGELQNTLQVVDSKSMSQAEYRTLKEKRAELLEL